MHILSSVNIMQMLPNMVSSISGDYKQAVQKFSLSKFAWNVSTFHIQFLGKGYDKALTEKETEYALSFLNQEPQNIVFFNRVLLRGDIYHSIDYERVTKRNNFTVKFCCPKKKLMMFGYVRFYGCHNGNDRKELAFIRPLKVIGSVVDFNETFSNNIGICVPHIQVCEETDCLSIVEIENLVCFCSNVDFKNSPVKFICESPNNKETD